MKATKKEKTYSKEYYATHKTYRDKKKKDRLEYAKTHREEEASYSKKYYHTHEDYRRKKIQQAKNYKKRHYNSK